MVGHAKGWGSPEQLRAVHRADEALGMLVDSVKAIDRVASTLTILTADHGGNGLLHPPEDPLSQSIPWIVAGPSVRKNFDLATVPDLTVTTTATFATVCAVLGIDAPEPIDGRVVFQALNRTRAGTP